MIFDSPYDAYEQLSDSVKTSMIYVIKSKIDGEKLKKINSSDFGREVLELVSSEDFKQHCGAYSSQCFGILLRDYLTKQPNWSGPKIVVINGRDRKIYSWCPG